jgi:hypothetical protein
MSGVTAVWPRLLDPTSTAAIILGTHDWADAGLGSAPAFLRSTKGIVAYLYSSTGLGLAPELVLDLFDDTAAAGGQPSRIQETLDVQLRERRDSGHLTSHARVAVEGVELGPRFPFFLFSPRVHVGLLARAPTRELLAVASWPRLPTPSRHPIPTR